MLSEIQKVILTCLLGPEDKDAWSREKAFWYYRNNTEDRLEYAKTYRGLNLEKAQESNRRSKLKNRDARFLQNRARREGRLRMLNLLKLGRPCYDCGNCFPPCCMDWDHLDASKKSFNVSRYTNGNLENIMTEIQKCQLVCANCHRIRTQAQNERVKQARISLQLVHTPESK